MINWIFTIWLIVWPIFLAITGVKSKKKLIKNKLVFYLKDTSVCLFILMLVYLINPIMYEKLIFSIVGKGIIVGKEIMSGIYPVFFIPLVFSLIRIGQYYQKETKVTDELFGYPSNYLPKSFKEYLFFSLYIIVGVIFEELICRQFMFFSFNKTLLLTGDVLLLISSILFALGHLYQGLKGFISSLVVGILLGKIFQMEENILYPIVLHMALNLTILVLSFRRIKHLKNTSK
jgi:membrane protease YdiL (CAAX protease family)